MSAASVTIGEDALQLLFRRFCAQFHQTTRIPLDPIFTSPPPHGHIVLECGWRLSNGTTALVKDAFRVSNLDVTWDPFDLVIQIDLPTLKIGGFCIIDSPFGCLLEFPEISLFGSDPDFEVSVPLGGLIGSRIVNSDFEFFWKDHFDADPRMTAHESYFAGTVDRYGLHLDIDPTDVHIELFRIDATVKNILDKVVGDFLKLIVGWMPDIVKEFFGYLVDWVIGLISDIFGIFDDLLNWLTELFVKAPSIFSFFVRAFSIFIKTDFALFYLDKNFPIVDADKADRDLPVLLPVRPVARPVIVPGQELKLEVEAT